MNNTLLQCLETSQQLILISEYILLAGLLGIAAQAVTSFVKGTN